MGRQWNTIIESLGPLTGGSMSINANLTDIEALLTTLQADVADGIIVSSGSSVVTNGTLAQLTNGTVTANVDFASTNGTTAPDKSVLMGWKDGDNIVPVNFNTPLPAYLTDSNISQFPVVPADGTPNFPISGTVTATPTRGTTTTGTLTAGTTNGTLFATNSTRNYLLVQCTSGTAFIDTNGTASTANGIQLTSGQGITFEGSFIPTGAIAAITSTGTAGLVGIQG